MNNVFSDASVTEELNRLACDMQVNDSQIVFRGKAYPINGKERTAILGNLLYSECYSLKTSFQHEGAVRAVPTTADVAFGQQLSMANHSSERTETGWLIRKIPTATQVEVTRNTQTRTVPSELIRSRGGQLIPGQQVDVYYPRENHVSTAGFYYAFGNRSIINNDQLVRIYWNIDAKGAAALTHMLTATLNHYHIPFIYKCLNHPDMYSRRDAAVLYIEENNCTFFARLLPDLCKYVNDYLHEDVPLFTYRYHKGVGIAENPGIYESFGIHRVRMVAEAILHDPHFSDAPEKLTLQVSDTFIKNGIDPEKPYLNKGSKKLML
jgi:hypothetical protein